MTDKPGSDVTQDIDLPLLPLRDVVVYPSMVIPLFVGRERSVSALEKAMESSKKILLVAQKNPAEDDPGREDIYDTGTIATILHLLKLPDGTIKVLVEGLERACIEDVVTAEHCDFAKIAPLVTEQLSPSESTVFTKMLFDQFEKYIQITKKVSPEIIATLKDIEYSDRLVDSVAAHLSMSLEDRQQILDIPLLKERFEILLEFIDQQLEVLQLEKKIRGRVKKQMEKSQREYYLNEQIKAIQKELGDFEEAGDEYDELARKIERAGMPKDAKEKAFAELNKLKMMSPMAAEATVVRGYIDWMISVPWRKSSRICTDLSRAEAVLDEDHYGLDEVKERILEYLAVQKRVRKVKGSVLCLVGPPGVGKTSLGESIARATNRKFARIALGGVRDEAEIRGHRRTYIGAMPGKLLQKMAKSGVKNPLLLLDEIDKIGSDMRGDPASALLEVLDSEQNESFNDHYLEVDYDLSNVMFVCTSNSMNIPEPLLDRLEIIRLPGYTEDEKFNIATKYLIPKQSKLSGIKKGELTFKEDGVLSLIRYYTREAGVRGLEREVAKITRKVVREHTGVKRIKSVKVATAQLEHYCGVRKYTFGVAEEKDQIGRVTGLAWTQVGGELLTIEAAAVRGKGINVRTGSLGDVMQESIQAALTVVRSRAESLGIDSDFNEKYDLHIHVPEGATPKDGPSAGIGMCTAIVSVLTGIAVRAGVAMTGEITLRGQVLAIGGLKEKLLAAHRGRIKTVIIPTENVRDLKDIPDSIKSALDIKPVQWIDEVLELALVSLPVVMEEKSVRSSGVVAVKPKKNTKKTRIKTH